MNMKIIAAIFVALTIIFAGLFIGFYAVDSSTIAHKNTQIKNSEEAYDNQKASSVLEAAYAHWNNITIENLSLVSAGYTNNATLNWVGGPLTGTYSGISQINATWTKFFALWSAVWFYATAPPTVDVHGNSAVVTSANQFVLTSFVDPKEVQYLNVSYTLDFMFMHGKWLIDHEIWHITGAGAISYTAAHVDQLRSDAALEAAFSHWNDITIENSSLLAPQYASNATLHWIGGPLTGTYSGVSSITATWNKFFTLWSAVWFYAEMPPAVNVHGNYANVTSMNQFILTPFNNQSQVKYLNISYTLDMAFSNNSWHIYNEIWHITGSGYISFAQEFVEYNEINALSLQHWNQIAIENLTLIMGEYDNNATLHWIGGPLNGTYNGYAAINSTWNKFFTAWQAVWFYASTGTTNNPLIAINGNTATVTASFTQFIVQNSTTHYFQYINTTYLITYYNSGFNMHTGENNYKIVNETFHITGSGNITKLE